MFIFRFWIVETMLKNLIELNIYGLSVRQVKRITRGFLISAIEKEQYNVIETRVHRYY